MIYDLFTFLKIVIVLKNAFLVSIQLNIGRFQWA